MAFAFIMKVLVKYLKVTMPDFKYLKGIYKKVKKGFFTRAR